MTIQAWVLRKLNSRPGAAQAIGAHGVRVRRPGRGDVIAYCPDSGGAEFTSANLKEALREVPGLQALVVVRRPLAAGVFEEAVDRGLLVATFGHFERALGLDDIATFVHPEESYLLSRLHRNPNVTDVLKIGLRAWRIERRNGLRPLTIVTHDRYEFTDDEMWQLLNQHPDVFADAFVITNPNSRGFGNRVVQSATGLGIVLCTLNEFTQRLNQPWT